MTRTRTLALSVAAALGVAFGTAALAAAQAPADPAKARHDAMEQVNDAMKVLGRMAKGQAPFDAIVVHDKATTIEQRLHDAAGLFPAGSDKGQTHAKPEVWSDRAGFDKAMQQGQSAAAALKSVKDEAAFRAALGTLGQSCKSCHDKYRMPDEH